MRPLGAERTDDGRAPLDECCPLRFVYGAARCGSAPCLRRLPLTQSGHPALDVGVSPPAPARLPRERIVWIPCHNIDLRATEADEARHLRDGQQSGVETSRSSWSIVGSLSVCHRPHDAARVHAIHGRQVRYSHSPMAAIRSAARDVGPARSRVDSGETAWGESRPVRAASGRGRGSSTRAAARALRRVCERNAAGRRKPHSAHVSAKR